MTETKEKEIEVLHQMIRETKEFNADLGEKLVAKDIDIKILTDVVKRIIEMDDNYSEWGDGRPSAPIWQDLVIRARESMK